MKSYPTLKRCCCLGENSKTFFLKNHWCALACNFLFAHIGYNRGQSSSVSPRGYGSTGSTPHSNGSAYSSSMNGYHSSAGSLGNMGRYEYFFIYFLECEWRKSVLGVTV